MSVFSSFRLFSPKIPLFIQRKNPISKTLISTAPNLSRFSFSSISIHGLPIEASSSSSSSVSSDSLQSIEELPPKLQEIVKLFQSVQEPKAKYEQLLFYGRKLTPLDTKFKTKENKVQGCVSQVWVRAYLDSDNNVRFEADSDSVLTKGLAALLVQGLSGQPVSVILSVSPDFATLLGLQQSLTPSRNNGFLNMLKLMQNKAFLLYKEAEEGGGLMDNGTLDSENQVQSSNSGSSSEGVRPVNSRSFELGNLVESSNSSSGSEMGVENLNFSIHSEMGSESLNSVKSKTGDMKSDLSVRLGSRGERIKEILERELHPVELEIEDISHQHAGHAGVRGSEGETHFNVRVVSKEFEGKSLVKRHRLVYNLLQEDLQSGLHALSIVAKTPSEANGE